MWRRSTDQGTVLLTERKSTFFLSFNVDVRLRTNLRIVSKTVPWSVTQNANAKKQLPNITNLQESTTATAQHWVCVFGYLKTNILKCLKWVNS